MRLTGSRVGLAKLCLYWARADVQIPLQSIGDAANIGTLTHAQAQADVEAENAESGDVNEELVDEMFRALVHEAEETSNIEVAKVRLNPSSLEKLGVLVDVWREWWPKFRDSPLEDMPGTPLEDAEVEQAFAIETRCTPLYVSPHLTKEESEAVDLQSTLSARELPGSGQRDYSAASDTEICMTADLVATAASGAALIVVDYKTGRGPHTYREHEDQMRCLGTAAALAYNYDEVIVIVAWITPDGVKEYRKTLDRLDMEIVVEELRRLVSKIPTAEPGAGLHCQEHWCPAQSVCPAAGKALSAVGLLEVDKVRLRTLQVRNNREALYAMQAKHFLAAVSKRLDAEIKAYADEHGGIDAPDGRIYSAQTTARETPRLDTASGIIALRRALGDDASDAVVTKVTTSFDAIYAAFKAKRDRGEKLVIKDEVAKTRELLREHGSLKVSEFSKYDWRKP